MYVNTKVKPVETTSGARVGMMETGKGGEFK
jgi:hypothetical protein